MPKEIAFYDDFNQDYKLFVAWEFYYKGEKYRYIQEIRGIEKFVGPGLVMENNNGWERIYIAPVAKFLISAFETWQSGNYANLDLQEFIDGLD